MKFAMVCVLAIYVLLMPDSGHSYEKVGYLCDGCSTDVEARQEAVSALPHPVCDWGPYSAAADRARDASDGTWGSIRDSLTRTMSGDYPICGAPERRVVIANPDTYQLFAYIVMWSQQEWDYIIVQDVGLTQDEIDGYELLIDFVDDWSSFVEQPMPLDQIATSHHSLATPLDGDCPEGTALDYVLDSTLEVEVKQYMKQEVAANLSDYQEHDPAVTGGTIGLLFRRIPVTFNFSGPERNAIEYIALEGPLNEYDQYGDELLYSVDLLGVNSSTGNPFVSFELQPAESEVLGAPLNHLLSGDVNVEDNSCVRNKLASVAERFGDGEWRSRASGHRINPSDLRGAPASGSGPLCYVDFYQGGQRLYTFLMSCDRTR